MQPESLIKLVGTGGVAAVENQWMALIESDALAPSRLVRYDVVLVELCKAGRQSVAETLAWTAIEALEAQAGPRDALIVAHPFLLALGDNTTLRGEAAKLFRKAFAECAGLEALLSEAGLEKGRPVRRAMRTLEVTLSLKVGDYLAARDDDSAARVEAIDSAAWNFDILHSGGRETLAAVPLADRYLPASPSAFRILKHFMPDLLKKRLHDDPASVVLDLCREHGNVIDGEKLESILSTVLPPEMDWKKWYLRARTGLKKVPNAAIEGRPPYVIRYVDAPDSLEDGFLREFESARDPIARLQAVEDYLRECRGREQDASADVLKKCFAALCKHAGEVKPPTADLAGIDWLAASRVGRLTDVSAPDAGAIKWMTTAPDPGAFLTRLPSESLFSLACHALAQARPTEWQEILLAVMPNLPMKACDHSADLLTEAGRISEDFDPVIQRVLASPLIHFEALLWLWDGPSSAAVPCPPLITLLTKIVRTMEDCRRNERVPRDKVKAMSASAKSALSARRCDRFRACMELIELGMASALKTQLRRLELLSRATRDDLLNILREKFPSLDAPAKAVPPWKQEDVLFVTSAGMNRRNADIEHHVNVKMKENARAIGEAAAHGDLSENSEYKFALEERDLLRARLAQMNAEMAMAVPISPSDVPTNHVGIGTRVVMRRVTDGQIYRITFLGPWEADGNAGIVNYKAPLAQEVLGRRVGEFVEFNHTNAVGTYEIVELQNALTDDGLSSDESEGSDDVQRSLDDGEPSGPRMPAAEAGEPVEA
jgi:transcription elongation GreA/GreB family factor